MGYAIVHSPCIICRKIMAYNPHKVPSVRVLGMREPICRDCVNKANPLRISKGLEPIHINPDAYEPIHESEL